VGTRRRRGVVEDYRRLIKTHEFCTLNTTGVEHAYRRLRMRVLVTCHAVRRGDMGSPKPVHIQPRHNRLKPVLQRAQPRDSRGDPPGGFVDLGLGREP